MTPKDIQERINILDTRPDETLPATIAHSVKRLDEQTRALWEIALQLSELNYRRI
jgi:hypothetical protein